MSLSDDTLDKQTNRYFEKRSGQFSAQVQSLQPSSKMNIIVSRLTTATSSTAQQCQGIPSSYKKWTVNIPKCALQVVFTLAHAHVDRRHFGVRPMAGNGASGRKRVAVDRQGRTQGSPAGALETLARPLNPALPHKIRNPTGLAVLWL